jgi:hypothetical protein
MLSTDGEAKRNFLVLRDGYIILIIHKQFKEFGGKSP